MTLKKILIFSICLFVSIHLYSQANRFDYESKVFDFFQNTIIKELPNKGKFTLWINLEKARSDPYWYPRCLENYRPIDSIVEVKSALGKINVKEINKEKFRLKSNGKGCLPVIFVNEAFTSKGLNSFVNLTVLYKKKVDIYHFELNDEGKIIDWCKGGYIY